jgi:hypothetical protein
LCSWPWWKLELMMSGRKDGNAREFGERSSVI